MKKLLLLAAAAALLAPQAYGKEKKTSAPASTIKVRNVLEPAAYGATHFGGYLGEKLDLCIDNRLMAQDIERVVQPFRDKPDGNWGFRSEFWGKWYTAAMQGYGYAPTAENRAVVDKAVQELIATQDKNGYIGTYLDENHLGEWDIWGRKYVMLGLLAYYDQTQDKSVLDAACKVADNLISETGPGSGVNIAATGWIGWKGLASCSVLEPIALLYQKTGDKRYLDFAEYIIKSWDTPNKLTPTGLRLVQEAVSGTPLWENERRAESLRNDVVFRRAVRNVPHYGRSALFRGLPQVDQHDHPRRNHDRRIGFDGRNLVPWQDAPNRTDVSGDGDLRDGNLDEVPVSNVAPDRRQPLCGRTGNQPLQRPARLDVAERRMVVVITPA